MANIYTGSVEWTAVAAWATLTPYVSTSNGGRGDYVRQLAAVAVGNERVFRCTTSGTSLVGEPTWTITKNGVTTETAGPVWTECTGQEADQVSGTWKAPHARLQNAFAATWGAAGDLFYVAHDHAQTQAAALTLTSPGTGASPCIVACVNSAGTVPPVSADLRTTATITTTGANALTINSNYGTYWYGITFNCGSGAVNSSLAISVGVGFSYFKNCNFAKLGTTASANAIYVNNAAQDNNSNLVLDNCSMTFGNVGDSIDLRYSRWVWKNSTALAGGSVPTTLIKIFAVANVFLADGVDFSAMGAETLVAPMQTASTFIFKDCKFGASAVVTAAPTSTIGAEIYVARSDSSGTNYRHEKYTYAGTQTVETTIVRTGGASDGTTPISWKIDTTANAKWIAPFECLPIAIWNDTTAANVTVTIYGIWAGIPRPSNDDIWIELAYLGSSASPLATINTTNTKADILAASALQPTDASTWGGSTVPFKMTVTLSAPQPAQKGILYAIVKAGRQSSIFYIDPKVVLS